MDDRAETQRIEERLPQGTDERLARPRLSTTSRGTITPVAILQPLSAPVGDVVMYTGPLQAIGWQLHGISVVYAALSLLKMSGKCVTVFSKSKASRFLKRKKERKKDGGQDGNTK